MVRKMERSGIKSIEEAFNNIREFAENEYKLIKNPFVISQEVKDYLFEHYLIENIPHAIAFGTRTPIILDPDYRFTKLGYNLKQKVDLHDSLPSFLQRVYRFFVKF